MCDEPGFLLPKILGLALMLVWLYFSFRKLYLLRNGEAVRGMVKEVVDNPDSSSPLNKIAILNFDYLGTSNSIEHPFTGSAKNFTGEVTIYIDKKDLRRSVVKSGSARSTVVTDFIVPIVFSILIIISFFRVCGNS